MMERWVRLYGFLVENRTGWHQKTDKHRHHFSFLRRVCTLFLCCSVTHSVTYNVFNLKCEMQPEFIKRKSEWPKHT